MTYGRQKTVQKILFEAGPGGDFEVAHFRFSHRIRGDSAVHDLFAPVHAENLLDRLRYLGRRHARGRRRYLHKDGTRRKRGGEENGRARTDGE